MMQALVDRIFHVCSYIILAIVLPIMAPAQMMLLEDREAHAHLLERLDSVMTMAMDSMAFPGGQLVVSHKGQIIVDRTYGHHTYDAAQPVQPDDLYDLASVTKVAAGVPALMYLWDRQLINLDGTLCDYFPFLCRSNKGHITLREALSHHGRLQPYIVFWQEAQRKNGTYRARSFKRKRSDRYPIEITPELFLHRKYKRKMHKAIRKTPLNEEPGYVYSGLTFLLYPDLAKELTGMRIDSLLRQHFYEPLGASTLTFNPLEHFPNERIVPTERDTFFRYTLVDGSVHDEASAMLQGLSTNAGLFGSARDLTKLLQLFLNQGTMNGRRYLSSEVIDTFTHCHYCLEDNRRGLGFDKPLIEYRKQASYVAQSASPSSFGHSGFTGTFFWVDPAYDMTFALFTNRVHPYRTHRKLYSMGIRPALHQMVYDYLEGLAADGE